MAIKSGASHSLATLLLTLISALLVYFLRYVGLFENIFDFMVEVSNKFSQWLDNSFNITITYELFPIIFVASILAFAWGIIFHFVKN